MSSKSRVTILLLLLVSMASSLPEEDSHPLLSKLRSNPRSKANVAVIFKSGVSEIYARVQARTRSDATPVARMTEVRQTLIEHTSRAQRGVVGLLKSQGVSYKSFWITNRIIVSGCHFKLAQTLASHLDVEEIREEIIVPVPQVEKSPMSKEELNAILSCQQDEVAPGVELVGAPQLWPTNITGQNMVVSNIDTGVRGTHKILRDNFLGDYGWFDPYERTDEPNDEDGHGTHTMGTIIVGREGFGVAPEARWMACKGCRDFFCYEEDLLACAQFTACPTLTDGSSPDCSKAPHVSSNSWGGPGGDNFYDDAIIGMQAAGVIVVFSAGNGRGCGNVGSPGDSEKVIGVAATDMDDVIAYFSSRGPSVKGTPKPDISAPGVDVISAVADGDEAFEKISGTSMACPHVAGGIALLIQNNPELAGDQKAVADILYAGAKKNELTGSNETCGGVPDTKFPNNVFGYGRLDIQASSKNCSV